MGDVLDDLTAQVDELAGMLDGLDDAGWARPSRCDGWSVADVVVHLTQTNDLAVASAEGTYSTFGGGFRADRATTVDDAAELAVAAARGRPGAEVGAAWKVSADAMLSALRACDPHARVTWVTGELAARTLPYAFTEADRTLAGPVVAELTGPDGEVWRFADDGVAAATTVRGPALDWCLVAGRRADPGDTALVADGPDATAVLELVRTYA